MEIPNCLNGEKLFLRAAGGGGRVVCGATGIPYLHGSEPAVDQTSPSTLADPSRW